MTTSIAPARSGIRQGRGPFGYVVRSEWTKFRTVRGWSFALVLAIVVTLLFSYLTAAGSHSGTCTGVGVCTTGHPFVPTGPDGEAVADEYEFVGRALTGDGATTVRVTALTGLISTLPPNAAGVLSHTRPSLASWAKAGILVTSSTKQGSAYAAVMVTGSHGVRFQYDYTHDRAGMPGPVSVAAPRWLRLVRSGDTLTGYDSTDGTNWSEIGTAHLARLPSVVQVGLFVTSPASYDQANNGRPTLATASFDQVSIQGQGASSAWRGQSIGSKDFYSTLGSGGYHRAGDSFVVSGSGDIAPGVIVGGGGASAGSGSLFLGLMVELIVVIVVAALFITSEYRRGLIRTTFTATPRRGRMLAAKAIVIGTATFVTALVATLAAIPLSEHILRANGNYLFPVNSVTELRIVVGVTALVAVAAIAVVALGTILRSNAAAITVGIVLFVLPYILASIISGAAVWLLRLTPAAAFAVLGALPRSAQVSYPYTFANGYYPLVPWAGFGVLCAYAVVALAVATFVLQRRDA